MKDGMRRESGDVETRARSGAAKPNTSGLARLAKLDDYRIADGEPDIRGWDVITADGWKLGEVDDLVVDLRAMRVRYIVVKISKDLLIADADRRVFLPLGTARLDDERDDVVVERVPIDGFAGFLTQRADFTRDDERAWRRAYGFEESGAANADLYQHALYDDRRFWSHRRQTGQDTPYIVRSPPTAER